MLKDVARHTFIYAIGNVGIRAASFLLIPLFTRTLSQDDFGLLATLLMINQVLLVFMNVGMRDTFVRFFGESKQSGNVAALLGSCLLVSLGMGGVVTVGILQFLQPFFESLLHAEDVTHYLVLTCLFTLAQCLCTQLMSFYRSDSRPLAFLTSGIACAFLLFLLNVLFLAKLKMGVHGALSAYLSTYCVFLSRYHGLRAVAIFSVGQKMAQLLVPFLVLPFQMALEPMVFNNLDKKDLREKLSNMLTYFVLVFLLVAVLFMTASRTLLFLAAPKSYDGAALVLAALLPTAFFLGLSNFGRVLLHIRLRTDITGGLGILFACISLALYNILIAKYAIHGALISANVVWVLQASVFLTFGLRRFGIPMDIKRLTIAGSGLLLVCALFIASPGLANVPFYAMIGLVIAAGGAVLKLSGFFTDEEIAAARTLMERCKCVLKR
jgi:O-antigen/teichoic acid export membrane protein